MDETREKTFDLHYYNFVHPPSILGMMEVTNDNNVDMNKDNQMKQPLFFDKLTDLWQDTINTHHNNRNDDDKDENTMVSCLEQCDADHMGWDNNKRACAITTSSNHNDQNLLHIAPLVLELDAPLIDNAPLTPLGYINNDDKNDNGNDSNNEIVLSLGKNVTTPIKS